MKGKLFKRVTSLLSAAAMLLTYADFSAIDFSVHAENGDEAPELVSYDVNGNGKIDDGEENWGYELDSADDLFWFSDKVNNDNDNFGNANAFLAEDITVNENLLTDLITVDEDGTATLKSEEEPTAWTPIGDYTFQYSGIFNGNNKTISGLYYNESDATYVGLFGLNSGTIENVNVTDSYFCGSGYVCGICGYNKGTIENCSNTGKVVGCYYVGGVCGENYYGTIEKCYNTGDVTATNEYAYVGGVCGHKSSGTISNCYNTGDVTATGEYAYVGGVCGKNYDTISNCYNTGDITATGDEAYVGGVCGGNNDGSISNCSNTGDVSGSDDVGGICGNNYLGEISYCYNTGDVTGTGNYVGGVCGDNFQSEISNCYNTGDVTGTGNYVGGVCGDNLGTITYCYNTGDVTPTGDAAYVGGVCGYNEECIITYCYYLNTVAEDLYATAMTAQQFASGEVCWLLNGGENQAETPVFFQNIGTDDLPVLDSTHNTVYKNTACDSVSDYYNNENKDQEHSYENGFCTVCDGYEPATDLNNDGVYEISNAGQLYWFAGLVNGTLKNINQIRYAHAVLTNDITVNSCVLDEDGELNEGDFRAWTPIGNISSKYSGTFDGAGYTISGLYFNDSGADYVGLFGANSRTIKNVIVADSYFYGNSKVGGICGSNSNKNGKIENCYNTAKVSGSNFVGGVCGFNYQATISNCFNTGNISAEEYVGGVCGYNQNKSTILNCYNTGKVSGSNYVGGISGENSDINLITNCYNTGKVEGSTGVGGICGNNCIDCRVTNCYYLEVDGLNGINGNTASAEVTAKNETDFASGEVCWLLNGGETQVESPAFFQTIVTDESPVLDSTHGTVYKNTACNGESDYYNNENKDQEHSYENGFCTICDGYEPATDLNNDGVYEISNAGQLYWFADKVNNDNDNYGEANAVLTNDIIINNNVLINGELNSDTSNFRPWINHGSQWYQGTFDGAGYTVSGLYFNESDATYVGLFGLNSGTIENVNVTDSYFCGSGYVCGICGYNKGTIENCSNAGKVVGCYYAGGICGDNATNGTITNCYNTGDVTATDAEASVGGVCGNNNGTITNCYNTGDVIATDEGASACGVCGKTNAAITNCYYLADTDDGNGGKTASQFASGEVCWILNNGDEQAETPVFYQTIGTDERPVFDSTHNTVYRTSPCVSYSNTIDNKDHVLDSKMKDATCTEDGHSEYWYCKDCGKYFSDADCTKEIETFETWMSENTFPASGHSYIDGICENCGAFEDGIGARLAGVSLSLDGSIGVNFYMQLAEEVLEDETAYILFTLPNGETSEIRVSDAERTELNGVEYYVFKCNVAATEMTDTIKAQIKTSSGNGTEYSYSVKEYADYLLAHTADNAKYAEAGDLVRAMLNYGAYAQTFKKYNTDILPCEPSDVSEYVISEHEYTASAGTKVEFAGANLSMLSNTTLRLFFEADDINGVTIMYDAEALEIGENNGLNFVEIANITPDELSNDFTVSISDGGLVTYSPMTYCYQVSQTSNDAALVNLVKAIAMYNDAAKAYFKEVKV